MAGVVWAAAACAKPKPVVLGEDRGLAPQLAVTDSQRPPRAFSATIAEPAHVVILAVFPGRGASVVYPGDTAARSVALPAGTHQLRADSLRVPATPDSALLRTLGIRTRLDSIRIREDSARRMGLPRDRMRDSDREMRVPIGLERAHYMLFVSREPINYATLNRRVSGVTIPIDPNEALSTVAKMARAATTSARWAAVAIETEFRRN